MFEREPGNTQRLLVKLRAVLDARLVFTNPESMRFLQQRIGMFSEAQLGVTTALVLKEVLPSRVGLSL